MSAPERIWAASVTENYGEWQTTTEGLPRPTEYVRADLYAALEAQLAERGQANRETVAKHVYDAMSWAALLGPDPATGTVPQWVDGGNSLGQDEARKTADAILSALEATPPAPKVTEVRPLDDWHEDYGDVVWWARLEGEWIGEAAWIGTPNDSDWPGYHTHWSAHPPFPAALTAAQEAGKPSTPEGQQCRCDKCNAVIELDVHVPDEIWKRISPKPIDGYKGGGLLCAQCIVDALTRPSEQAVTEEMLGRACRAYNEYHHGKGCPVWEEDHPPMRAALKAAIEAGR